MNTRERVLKEALNCVNGEREKQYGNPENNFRRIADLWSVYLTSLFEDEKVVVDIDPIDVAKMMVLFKIARSLGDQDKLDNYVDMIGYAACGAEIFESSEKAEQVLKKKEELGVQLADECKDCDYAEKCIGTGVCLKEEEEKWFNGCDAKKDKPDEKCNRKDCGQFDACMTAYQHYIYNKTKEASEAIDEARIDELFEKYRPDKNENRSILQEYTNISAHIALESSKVNINPFDVVEQLIKNGHAPTDMAALLHDGKLNFDDIASYVEDVINELNRATALPSGKSNLKCFRCIHRDISKNNYPCNECLAAKDKGMPYFTTNDTKFGAACCNCVHSRANPHNYPCNICIVAYGSPYYIKREDKK